MGWVRDIETGIILAQHVGQSWGAVITACGQGDSGTPQSQLDPHCSPTQLTAGSYGRQGRRWGKTHKEELGMNPLVLRGNR